MAELKEGEKLFPLAKPISEGIQGAVADANAYTDEKLAPLRTDVKGINQRMGEMTTAAQSVEVKATSIERAAGEASSAAQHAESVAEIAKSEAERAAESAQAAAASLREIAERDDRAPKIAVEALEAVVKATVSDVDGDGSEVKVTKTGQKLIQHLADALENAKRTAGLASADADECKGLLEQAKSMIADQKEADEASRAQDKETIASLERLVEKAEQAAEGASGSARESAGTLAQIKGTVEQIEQEFGNMKIVVSTIAEMILGKVKRSDPIAVQILESAIIKEDGDS